MEFMYERDENRLTISMLMHIIILALLYNMIRAGRVNPSQPSVQEFPDEYYCFTTGKSNLNINRIVCLSLIMLGAPACE